MIDQYIERIRQEVCDLAYRFCLRRFERAGISKDAHLTPMAKRVIHSQDVVANCVPGSNAWRDNGNAHEVVP